jgi:hypothetical protein
MSQVSADAEGARRGAELVNLGQKPAFLTQSRKALEKTAKNTSSIFVLFVAFVVI